MKKRVVSHWLDSLTVQISSGNWKVTCGWGIVGVGQDGWHVELRRSSGHDWGTEEQECYTWRFDERNDMWDYAELVLADQDAVRLEAVL